VPTGQLGQLEKLMYARTVDHVEKALLKEGQGGVDMNKAENDSARTLLIEGASSYPLAATAFDQFIYKVHELCDDVIKKDINKISAALGITARPEDFEESPDHKSLPGILRSRKPEQCVPIAPASRIATRDIFLSSLTYTSAQFPGKAFHSLLLFLFPF
jgi:hypothetical protein